VTDQIDETLPGEETPASPAAPAATEPPNVTLSTEVIRSSPEYQELQRQNRALARDKGNLDRQLAESRANAERDRQQAQAQLQEQQAAEIESLLGADGLEEYNRLAELSATDPIAAARMWAESKAKAQVQAGTTATEEQQVTQQEQQRQAPPPPRALDAGSPLATVADDSEERFLGGLDEQVKTVVDRNQRMSNQVTDKERQGGMMAYLRGSLIRKNREEAG